MVRLCALQNRGFAAGSTCILPHPLSVSPMWPGEEGWKEEGEEGTIGRRKGSGIGEQEDEIRGRRERTKGKRAKKVRKVRERQEKGMGDRQEAKNINQKQM